MKEQNIIRMKCITILLFIILSVVLIVVGFSQEYRSSSLFSGGVGGLIVSLYMLKTIWSAKASQRKREQLIIDETDVTAGDVKKLELEVRNTGSSLLKDIQLSANKPADWEVTFEPSKVDALKAGETSTVMATLKASKKALPGDYVTTIMAKTPEVNADAQFRIAVKTPMIWGWVGVLIIIATIGVVYYLFRKYGRR